MKTIATILLLGALPALAQEGRVLYEETVKIEIELPPEMANMDIQIPDSRTSSKMVYFDETASLTKEVREEEQEQEISAESEGFGFRMRIEQPDNQTYVRFDDDTMVEQREFLGRTFLISDSVEVRSWRLTGERSVFLGYDCQKAVAMEDSVEIEAWFTTEIPVPAGPGPYFGLPGLVLLVSVDGGRNTLVAKEVVLEPLAENAPTAPEKGRAVSRAEFDKIVAEKMEEMGAQPGRGGNMMRVIVRDH